MMNKLWVKIKFEQGENVEKLVKAFFREFRPQNSLVIKDNEAKMEIIFQEIPELIIEAIDYCEVIELHCGKNLKEYEDETEEPIEQEAEKPIEQEAEKPIEQEAEKPIEQEAEEPIEQEAEEPIEQEAEEPIEQEAEKPIEQEAEEPIEQEVEELGEQKVEETVDQQKKKRRGRPAKKEIKLEKEVSKIPELDEIAKKANSFEHFAELVAEWLEMKERKIFCANVIIASVQVDGKITWRKLEKILKNNAGYSEYSELDKTWVGQQISKKLENSVTMLPFLNAIKEYSEYPFKNGGNNDSIIPKKRVKMECMPEIKEFEEVLASVDMTKPVMERVRYVLDFMGLKEIPERDKERIMEFVSTAVKIGKMTYEVICVKAKIPSEDTFSVRMNVAEFINHFVHQYEKDKDVKVLTFLSELQKIIVRNEEIESFSDFD